MVRLPRWQLNSCDLATCDTQLGWTGGSTKLCQHSQSTQKLFRWIVLEIFVATKQPIATLTMLHSDCWFSLIFQSVEVAPPTTLACYVMPLWHDAMNHSTAHSYSFGFPGPVAFMAAMLDLATQWWWESMYKCLRDDLSRRCISDSFTSYGAIWLARIYYHGIKW